MMAATIQREQHFALQCMKCTASLTGYVTICPECGGLVDTVYRESDAPEDAGHGDLLNRYRSVMPLLDLASYRAVLPVTPLVELAPIDGVRVLGKLEARLPTGSTKDRLAAIALPFMLERGVRRFAFSSTGNTAAAYAHALHLYPELEARLYLSSRVDRATIGPMPPNLSVVVVRGDYSRASARLREQAPTSGYTVEGGFFNIGRREGAKLAYLEALEQARVGQVQVKAIVQAVASGLGIYAAWRAIEVAQAREITSVVPSLFCVQQASCAPMVAAYSAETCGQRVRPVLENPQGIAPALLLGNPYASYDYVAAAVRRSGGDFLASTEVEIQRVLDGRDVQAQRLGASAAVALAALPKVVRSARLEKGDAILVMLTGGHNR
jgi:threonine synthase